MKFNVKKVESVATTAAIPPAAKNPWKETKMQCL